MKWKYKFEKWAQEGILLGVAAVVLVALNYRTFLRNRNDRW
jgi:hypothetical protein